MNIFGDTKYGSIMQSFCIWLLGVVASTVILSVQ